MASPPPQSLTIYRSILRAVKKAFDGDATMLSAAQREVRARFEDARQLNEPEELERRRAEGAEAAQFIATMVVQAPVNARGNPELTVAPELVGAYVEPVEEGMPLPREKGARAARRGAEGGGGGGGGAAKG